MSANRETLAAQLDQAAWSWLSPHAQRDALIVVSRGLNLLDAGEAVANDDTATVRRWIADGRLSKPSAQQLSDWNATPQKSFDALIVQPYVLIRERDT